MNGPQATRKKGVQEGVWGPRPVADHACLCKGFPMPGCAPGSISFAKEVLREPPCCPPHTCRPETRAHCENGVS